MIINKIEELVTDSFQTIYITNKLFENEWKLTNETNKYNNGNEFRSLMLSKGLMQYLMIVSNQNYVDFLIYLEKDKDFDSIKELDIYRIKYKARCEILNNQHYYYNFRFSDFDLFNSFYKDIIIPKMGLEESNITFSWI